MSGKILIKGLFFVLTSFLLFTSLSKAYGSFSGIYNVSGSDSRLGNFSGQTEIRQNAGNWSFIRVVDYLTSLPDGKSLSTAWEGTATIDGNTIIVSVNLARLDFIKRFNSMSRSPEQTFPLSVKGSFLQTSPGNLSGNYSSLGDTGFDVNETWTYAGNSATLPIFQSKRIILNSHKEPDRWTKQGLFILFKAYQEHPFVAQYRDRPEFKKAIHMYVRDRTNFEYYRANPNSLRLVNKIVDDISIAEEGIKASAFRYKKYQKADFYGRDMQVRGIDQTGMVAKYKLGTEPPIFEPNGDSALWTGIYVAGECYRYKITGAQNALDNAIRSLKALLALVDVTGNPTQFARTLMVHKQPPGNGWHQGTSQYSWLDWKDGGNNDMIKGLEYGYLVAYDTLPDSYDDLKQTIRDRTVSLARYSKVAKDGAVDEMTINGMAFHMTGESEFGNRFKQLAGNIFLKMYTRLGLGPFYYQGISGWSGSHLHAISTITLLNLLKDLNDPRLGLYERGARMTFRNICQTRPGLWAIVAMGPGKMYLNEEPDCLSNSLFMLDEFPYPKPYYEIDHSMKTTWCISPYPSLPWKLDWWTNPRYQGLIAYPLFEINSGICEWKRSRFSFRNEESGCEEPGFDYLHAYWLGRFYGIIGTED